VSGRNHGACGSKAQWRQGKSRSSRKAGIPALVTALEVLLCSPAPAQDRHLTKTTKADHDVAILGYGQANQSCEAIEPPSIYLDKPPGQGSVCFRASTIKLREAIVGNLMHCIGRTIRGVTVVYLPRSGYTGPDDVRYTVIFPSARHSVYVDVTVVPDSLSSPGTLPADIGTDAVESSQLSGPMPACMALVS
jgi:hypothetical protein